MRPLTIEITKAYIYSLEPESARAASEQARDGLPVGPHGRLIWKLYAGFLTVALVGVALAGVLVDRNVQRNSLAQVEGRLDGETLMLGQMTASALFGELEPNDTSLD